MDQLARMRTGGIDLAIDDFGTGYSALSYLSKFGPEVLKIDRSFIADITTDEGSLAIVESILLMARRLGISTIAEGVETEEQFRLLAAAGCDMAQGYLFARPIPAHEFLDFVSAWNPDRGLWKQ
jgi:EAL domain-containing protein (putative c-di-GMP-specific phosphodiesterase class I)